MLSYEQVMEMKKENPGVDVWVFWDESGGDASRRFHTDYVGDADEADLTPDSNIIDVELMDEEELNHSIFANCSISADKGEKKIMVLLGREKEEWEKEEEDKEEE